MAFTRDDMAAYEAKPQIQVEIVSPFAETPATPAATTPETPAAEVAATTDAPSADVETDPAALGDGTSGETDPATTPVAAADPDGEVEPPTAAAKPHKGSAQERITELVDEKNALRKYGDHMSTAVKALTDEIARLKATVATTPAAATTPEVPAAPAVDTDPAPSMEDADVAFDVTKFAKKNAEWTRRQIAKGIEEGVSQVATKQTAQQTREAFQTRVDTFEAANPDFKVVIGNPNLPQLSPDAVREITTTEDGVAILYHLGKNVDIATRIAKLPQSQQMVRIGEIRAQLKAATVVPPAGAVKPVKPKSTTQAPPPPTPTAAGSRATERPITDPALSMDEFVRLERERKNAERVAKRNARGLSR